MADNPEFHKLVCKNVKLLYPRLDQTYRFNKQKNVTERCAPNVTNAAWSISWEVEPNEARAIYATLRDHYNTVRATKPSLPPFSKIFGMKKLDSGNVMFSAKRKGVNNAGELNKEPAVLDAKKQPLENRGIWTGSIGSVIANCFPVADDEGVGGISMILRAVQVRTPIYGSDSYDDFDEYDDAPPAAASARDSYDDFDEPAPAPRQQPQRTTAEVLGDEIPF